MRLLPAILLAALLTSACEPPPEVEAIQQAATCGGPSQPPCVYVYSWQMAIHIRWHLTYDPNADQDLTNLNGGYAEIMPRESPQTFAHHQDRLWWGAQPTINQISPFTRFHYFLNHCPPTGVCPRIADGVSNDGAVEVRTAGPGGRVGPAGYTYQVDVPPKWVSAGQVWLTISPMCKQTGAMGNGQEARQSWYSIATDQHDLYIDLETGSPYFEPTFWEGVARGCNAGWGIFTRGQEWHDPYWQYRCIGPWGCYLELAYDPDFHWW